MSEREMYMKIRKITLILAGVSSLAALLIFRMDASPYILGLILGALMGIISFNMIINMASKINEHNAQKVAVANYITRFLGIGVIFFFAMTKGIDIFALMIGFICSKIAIQLFAQLERKGFYESN